MLKNYAHAVTLPIDVINMKHHTIAYLILFALYAAFCSRYYYMKGMNEAGFDRETANMKLEQCHDIIKGMNK